MGLLYDYYSVILLKCNLVIKFSFDPTLVRNHTNSMLYLYATMFSFVTTLGCNQYNWLQC